MRIPNPFAMGVLIGLLSLALFGCSDVLGPEEGGHVLIKDTFSEDCPDGCSIPIDWEWSPDGESVVYRLPKGYFESRQVYEIRIRRIDSGEDRALVEEFHDDRVLSPISSEIRVTRRYVYFVVDIPPYGYSSPRQLYRVSVDGGPVELLLEEMSGNQYAVHPDDTYLYATPYGAEEHGRRYRLDTRKWEEELLETVRCGRMIFEPGGHRAIARAQLLGEGMVAQVLDLPAGEGVGQWRMAEDVLSENSVELRWNTAWRDHQPFGVELAAARGEPVRLMETNMLSGAVRTVHTFAPEEDLWPGEMSLSRDGRWVAMWVGTCAAGAGECPWSMNSPATLTVIEILSGAVFPVTVPWSEPVFTDFRPRISPNGCWIGVTGPKGLWVLPVQNACS
jgi:hypothetical protein